MPLTFTGTREIPFPQYRLPAGNITDASVREVLTGRDAVSISVTWDFLSDNSLGYIIHVLRTDDGFLIQNLDGTAEVTAIGEDAVAAVLRHVSGIEYSALVQDLFFAKRNAVGMSPNDINRLELGATDV